MEYKKHIGRKLYKRCFLCGGFTKFTLFENSDEIRICGHCEENDDDNYEYEEWDWDLVQDEKDYLEYLIEHIES